MARSGAMAGAALACAIAAAAHAEPLFVDSTKNAAVLEESALTAFLQISDSEGAAPGQQLAIADASFTATSWSFSLVGGYRGLASDIAFSAVYDPVAAAGSFTSVGMVGAAPVAGFGNWSWRDAGDDEEDLLFTTSLTFADRLPNREFDLEPLFEKKYRKLGTDLDGEDIIEDFGEFWVTHDGLPTGFTQTQHSQYEQPPPPRRTIFAGWTARESATLGDASINAVEAYSSGGLTGTLAGTVSSVPEPSAFVLLLAGTAAGGALARRRAGTATNDNGSGRV